jgi:Tol biopolymer transport system component
MHWSRLITSLLAASAVLLSARGSTAAVEGNTWVSLDSLNSPPRVSSGAYSYPPSITADGRYVAFESLAPLVHDAENNDMDDVFLRDTQQLKTELISAAADGGAGNNRSHGADLSADASFVVFESLASNLLSSDANSASDIFLRDRVAGRTIRVSAPAGGEANGSSYRPAISGDGNWVAFCSRASNLVPDDGNTVPDAFLWSRADGAITRIPAPGAAQSATDGCLSVAVSNDGGVVAFAAAGGGTRGVFAYNRTAGTTTALTSGADGPSGTGGVAISGDGRLVAHDSVATNLVANDTNRSSDVFVNDLQTHASSRVSVRSDGSQLPGSSGASGIAISSDGKFVVFGSTANGVVPGDSNGNEDVFRRDLAAAQTTIVSVNLFDRSANGPSYSPDLNADGSVVAYTSLAENIVVGDNNGEPDIFVRGTNFASKAGDSTAPLDTGAPPPDQAPPVSADDGGLPQAAIIGAAAAIAVVLAGGWLLLGRRGRA